MASKVNTKLVLFLVLAVGLATAIIGGLYVLNLRHNAGRNARIGDEKLAAGDLEGARNNYARAVAKEPANMQYVRKLESTLLQTIPNTADNARELYNERVGIYSHIARYDPTNPEPHLTLLNELLDNARQVGNQRLWDPLISASDFMWEHVAEDNPKRILAKLYRSIATVHLSTQRTAAEFKEAVTDLDQVVKAYPTNDLAWAMAVQARSTDMANMRISARSRETIDQQIREIEDTLAKAMKAVPDSAEVARVELAHLVDKQNLDPKLVQPDQITQAATRLASLVKDDAPSGLVTEVVSLLASVPGNGIQSGIDLLNRYVAAHPKELEKQFMLARLSYFMNKTDEAERVANVVLNADPLPVSFVSQLQFELRKQAAGLLSDIQYRRFEAADQADKAARMKALEDARTKLASLVTDQANDPLLLRADGKIAFAKGEYNKAAQSFERIIKESSGADVETMLFSALSLGQVGQLGLAYERLTTAGEGVPNNPMLLLTKARMEVTMGRFDDAAATLKQLPASELERDEVKALVSSVKLRTNDSSTTAPAKADPVVTALASASASMNKGEIESARATLTSAMQAAPNDGRLIQGMIQLEAAAGQLDKAREFLTRALAANPDSPDLKRLQALLKYDDPIQSMAEMVKVNNKDEKSQALAMMSNLVAMHLGQQAMAARMEYVHNADAAAKAKQLAERAKTEAGKYADRLEQLAPDDIQLLEYRFNEAITSQNWSAAEPLLAKAKAINADQADGLLYKGRYELVRGNTAEAIRNLESACDRLSFSAQAWRVLGFAYESASNLSMAQRAYERAYKCNPNDLDNIRRYVFVLRQLNQGTRALDVLQRVHQIAPQDAGLRDAWLEMENQIGDKAVTLSTRLKIYADTPGDRQNATRLAALLGDLEPTRELIPDSSGNLGVSEQRWARMTATDREQLIKRTKEDWIKTSDAILDKLSADSKDDLALVALRASLLRQRGDVSGGEQLLHQFIGRTDPSKVTAAMLIELGRYQVRSAHMTEAIDTFKEALKLQDPKKHEADIELANLYSSRLGKFDLALQHLEAIAKDISDRTVTSQMVECLARLKRFDEAEKKLQDLNKANGEDYTSVMLAASLADARGRDLWEKKDEPGAQRQFEQQRDALSRAELLQPTNPGPRVMLADSYVAEYQRSRKIPKPLSLLDDAMQALNRADNISPGAGEITMGRVAVYKLKNDNPAAVRELQRYLEHAQHNLQARYELIQLNVAMGKYKEALTVADEGIKLDPTLPVWYEAKGEVYKTQRILDKSAQLKPAELTECVAMYAKAFDISPSSNLLQKLADATFVSPNPDCKGLATRFAARSEDVAQNPALKELYAKTLACAGRQNEAIQLARDAYAQRKQLIKDGKDKPEEIARWFSILSSLFPATPNASPADLDKVLSAAEQFVKENAGSDPDVYNERALATMWIFAGDSALTKTLDHQRKAIAKCPAGDAALKNDLNMELANFLLVSSKFDDAVATYKLVLQNDPKNVAALNNMAFVMAEDLKDPSSALVYAQKALELAPTDGPVMDTLGRVLYHSGDNDKAIEMLRKSLEKTDAASTHVHLAEALLKSGDFDGAQRHLENAQKLELDATTQQKINALQDDIKKRRTAGRS